MMRSACRCRCCRCCCCRCRGVVTVVLVVFLGIATASVAAKKIGRSSLRSRQQDYGEEKRLVESFWGAMHDGEAAASWRRLKEDKKEDKAEVPACADEVKIDFSRTLDGSILSNGDLVDLRVGFDGVQIQASRRKWWVADEEHDGMIFDAAMPTGGDDDLLQPAQGNVLIISQDNNPAAPRENRFGGTIEAIFEEPSTVKSIVVLDSDNRNNGRILLYDPTGRRVLDKWIPRIPNGALQTIELDVPNVERMEVVFQYGCALDDLVFERPCPVCLEQITFAFLSDAVAFGDGFSFDLRRDHYNGAPFYVSVVFDDYVMNMTASPVEEKKEGNVLTIHDIRSTGTYDPDAFGAYNPYEPTTQVYGNSAMEGKIVFEDPTTVYSFFVLDYYEFGGHVKLIDTDNQEIKTIELEKSGIQSALLEVDVMAENVRTMIISLRGLETLPRACEDSSSVVEVHNSCTDEFIVDFQTLRNGTALALGDKIDNMMQFDGGVTVKARKMQSDGPYEDAMIFDADHPTGGDNDLRQVGQGNVLIISKDGDSSVPNDNSDGGDIIFTFEVPSTVVSVVLFDTSKGGDTIEFTDKDGYSLSASSIPIIDDGTMQTLVFPGNGVSGVKKMHIRSQTIAVDDLRFRRACVT